MTLNNINSLRKDRGFTIVELLIVIVVIAILAAITIVAYNGIQNRAKTSSGQSLANTIVKKAEAYNTVESAYPNTTKLRNNESQSSTTANSGPTEAKLDDNTAVLTTATSNTVHGLTASGSAGGTKVAYWGCAGGANVWYWDFTSGSSGAAVLVKAGAGC